jgi:hypothetical protein
MTDYEIMLASLENLANKDVDLEPMVGHRFLAQENVDLEVFSDGNALQLEYMVTKVVEMLLFFAEGNPRQDELGYYDVPFHDDLGVTWPMYTAYMHTFLTVLGEVLDEQWDAVTASAWQRQVDAMLAVIKQHSEVA